MSLSVRLGLSLLVLAAMALTVQMVYRVYASGYPNAAQAAPSALSNPIERQASIKDLDITLTERSGKPFALKSLEGQVWIGSFFFASCPGTCRQINIAIGGLQQELAGKDVKLVSITVDPENDTPAVLAQYAKSFEADPNRWLFLTGNFKDIQQVCQNVFALAIDRKVHSEKLSLFDHWGYRRGVFSTGDASQMAALKRGVDKLLAETEPPKMEKRVVTAGDDS
jgi:cytochrome oxidase Cu insertion factor (SCO1/SenC/PrrC family)